MWKLSVRLIRPVRIQPLRLFTTQQILFQHVAKSSPQAVKPVSPKSNNEAPREYEIGKLSQSIREHLEKSKKSRQLQIEESKNERAKQTFKQNFKTIFRIFTLGKPDLKLFLIALGFILFAVLYPTAAVKLVGASIDAFNSRSFDEDGNVLIWGFPATTVFGFMAPFMVVSAVCFWARIWLLKILGERLVARLRLRVMKNIMRHDSKFFDNEKHKVGDLMSRLSSDAYVVSRSITGNLPDGLKNVLFAVISSYMMWSINPLLFGVMMLISPPITFGSVWYGEQIRKLSTNLQNSTANLTKISEETLNSMKLVQAFTTETKELTRYSDQLRNVVGVAKKEAMAQSNYSVSIYSLYHTGYLSCVALGVYSIANGWMTTGDVVAFTMYSELFNSALYSLTTTYLELMKGAGAGVKLFELIDHKNDVDTVKGSKINHSFKDNSVEFRDVEFSYPTRPQHKIFDGCSFKVASGSSTCFVAPSGCGKSTIATLLLRFYNLNKGQILIGGEDISKYQVRELRRKIIGIVQQEPILISGSILENIVYGLTAQEINKLTMEDIITVSNQANLEFIDHFSDGFDTMIGAKGASLSGGQKQRIAIARALIKKPKILILDEATSALDSKSESLINETLKNISKEGSMTIISIAHRLSTISKSENVVVLGKEGKVVESGRFIDLFSNSNSELSKLLDESIDEEEPQIEEAPEDQPEEEDLEKIRNLIYNLPIDKQRELLSTIYGDDRSKVTDTL
ncbi:iron-sulfur clusters transporter Atm1p, mitochondrial [[Candida] jaroonii]|uniref:Iron-sulfur clusters transporter Atm1p, mitochondrial n=1 Tax=[Candida] jaroonii TaxID=467808 RepID=A0ACA9Y8N7_9ASCO|nr:iron-sulfur clusters transporter Atm1p, mitochondrial [[Candida] jaroonii]